MYMRHEVKSSMHELGRGKMVNEQKCIETHSGKGKLMVSSITKRKPMTHE